MMKSSGRMCAMRQVGSQARIRGAAIPKRQAEGEGPAEENDWMRTEIPGQWSGNCGNGIENFQGSVHCL